MSKASEGQTIKQTIRRIIKKIAFFALLIIALMAIIVLGTWIYNSVSLRKEVAWIKHKGQYVEVDGHNMNLYIEGAGEHTLVFMAGAGCPSPVLEFKPLADDLSARYRVVIIEKFGYGYSDEIDGERTVGVMAEQDREALRKAGIEAPYILCPHSASGFEAVWWANKYPDEVEAIIGLDMAVPEQYDYVGGGVDWDGLTPEDPEKSAEEMGFYDFWVYKVGFMRYMNAGNIFPALKSDALTKEEKREYKALMYAKYGMGSEATLNHESWLTERYIKEMREICAAPIPDVPTLLFAASDKMMERMTGSVENWQSIHENYMANVTIGKLVKLDSGHYVHIEETDRVRDEIIDFVDSLSKMEE